MLARSKSVSTAAGVPEAEAEGQSGHAAALCCRADMGGSVPDALFWEGEASKCTCMFSEQQEEGSQLRA
jgi:hypothetical protein